MKNTKGGVTKMIAGVALTLLTLVVALLFFIYRQNSEVPQLGHRDGVLTALPKTPNAVSSQTSDVSRRVQALPFKGSLSESKAVLLAVINSYDRAEIIKDEGNYIRAVFTSRLFRFHDDVEFYLDDADGLIHFRSASRAGKSDLGVNRQRYESIAARYTQ